MCALDEPSCHYIAESIDGGLGVAAITFSTANISDMAELNKFETKTRGEFGIRLAAQFGSADLKKANFTPADMRKLDFSGSTFNGAYLVKAVAYKANFKGRIVIGLYGKIKPITAGRLSSVPIYNFLVFILTFVNELVLNFSGCNHITILNVMPTTLT
ncbi:Pentapeptide repeat-containing protein [Perilla frutescens var. hirtella]|nr:Pentapeptide repeat-containing protein [Perilla frutescens var. hirtella]